MTVHEGPVASPLETGEQSIDYNHFLDTYGLGPQELNRVVVLGGHVGTVATMLSTEFCPVGGVIAGAYQAEGIAGVETKFSELNKIYGVELSISESTRSYHEGKVELQELLRAPAELSEQKPAQGKVVSKEVEEQKECVSQAEMTPKNPEGIAVETTLLIDEQVKVFAAYTEGQQVKLNADTAVTTEPLRRGNLPLNKISVQARSAKPTVESTDTTRNITSDSLGFSELLYREENEAGYGISVEPDQLPKTDVLEAEVTTALPIVYEQTAESAVVEWERVLGKEPLEIYDDFTEALFAVEGDDSAVHHPETESRTVPEIVVQVAERLDELEIDAREDATQILRSIVGAIHGLRLLEAQDAEPETIKMVEAQLRELCIALFESIGIEYSEQDVEEFMSVLQHKDFQPAKSAERVAGYIDLEYTGMRNVKKKVHHSGGRVVRTQIKQMIGMFAILRLTSPSSVSA